MDGGGVHAAYFIWGGAVGCKSAEMESQAAIPAGEGLRHCEKGDNLVRYIQKPK